MDVASGEHVIFEGHPSWRSTLGFYLKGLVFVLLAAVAAGIASKAADDSVKGGWVAAAAVVVLALVLVIGYLRRIATTYVITNQRLHIKRGIVSRRTQDARLERVQNVNTGQSALERILQVGTVDFDTAGTDGSDFSFAGVADPSEVVAAVDRAQREHAAESQDPGRAPGL